MITVSCFMACLSHHVNYYNLTTHEATCPTQTTHEANPHNQRTSLTGIVVMSVP